MKRKNKIFLGIGVLIILVVVIFLTLNHYVKNEIVNGLEQEFPGSSVSYEDVSVNLISGSTLIKNFGIKNKGVSIDASDIHVNGLSYFSYLKSGDIQIDNIELKDPQITFNKSDTAVAEEKKQPIEKTLRLHKFSAINGSFRVIENDSASNSLYININEVVFRDITLGKETDGELLPFEYKTVEVDTDSIYSEMNDEHYITLAGANYRNKELKLTDFRIIPKYSKAEFDRAIPFEKDWVALRIEGVIFDNFSWGKPGDTIIFKSQSTALQKANVEIYRNKLLPDDNRIKPLYSQMLRELGVKLVFDTINITDSQLVYKEKVSEKRSSGEINFQNIDVTISNLTNYNLEAEDFPQTKINAQALFMGQSKLTLNLTFDVRNEMDEFNVSGRLSSIPAKAINSFMVPAMGVEAEGEIESLAYNFYGNRIQAKGDMQLAYRDFKVNILREGKEDRKSLLSRLANLILKNNVINEDVEQENIETTRDQTKSFWNFLWLCIRDGALKTFF